MSTCPTPLLEEEGHALAPALAADVDDPISEHWPGVRAAFPSDDDPVDSMEVQTPQIRQQRFYRKKPYARGRGLK